VQLDKLRSKTMSIIKNTIGSQIKKELKAAFPGITFSVRYSSFAGGNSVDISWLFGPTTGQVEAISNKYQAGHFNGMEDIYEYREADKLVNEKGELVERQTAKYVSTSRQYSTDYKSSSFEQAAAAEYCERHGIEHHGKPMDAFYKQNGYIEYVASEVKKMLSKTSFKTSNPEFLGFEYCNNGYECAYRETVNGETVEVTRQDIELKHMKQEMEYYKELYYKTAAEKDAARSDYYALQQQVKEEKIARLKPAVLEVEDKKLFVTDAMYANLNKKCTLKEYHHEVTEGNYQVNETLLTDIVYTTDEGYDFLINNLMEGQEYMAGKGGNNSRYNIPAAYTDKPYWEWPKDELEKVKSQIYTLGMLVYHPTRELFIIDPQGYNYARYVALIPKETQQQLRTFVESL
jgi:hypothetical protein